jgi:hypothetical protein
MNSCGIPLRTSLNYDSWVRACALDAASRVMSGLTSQDNWPGETVTGQTLVMADWFESYLRNGYNGG